MWHDGEASMDVWMMSKGIPKISASRAGESKETLRKFSRSYVLIKPQIILNQPGKGYVNWYLITCTNYYKVDLFWTRVSEAQGHVKLVPLFLHCAVPDLHAAEHIGGHVSWQLGRGKVLSRRDFQRLLSASSPTFESFQYVLLIPIKLGICIRSIDYTRALTIYYYI